MVISRTAEALKAEATLYRLTEVYICMCMSRQSVVDWRNDAQKGIWTFLILNIKALFVQFVGSTLYREYFQTHITKHIAVTCKFVPQ